METSLSQFFEQYMFEGQIELSSGYSPFSIEVFYYDLEKRSLVALGKDNRGLSSLIGEITPKNETEADIRLKQVFSQTNNSLILDRPFLFLGNLRKTSDDIILDGTHKEVYTLTGRPFELKATPKEEHPSTGYMDKARALVLPR
jgi:hypothetical protein